MPGPYMYGGTFQEDVSAGILRALKGLGEFSGRGGMGWYRETQRPKPGSFGVSGSFASSPTRGTGIGAALLSGGPLTPETPIPMRPGVTLPNGATGAQAVAQGEVKPKLDTTPQAPTGTPPNMAPEAGTLGAAPGSEGLQANKPSRLATPNKEGYAGPYDAPDVLEAAQAPSLEEKTAFNADALIIALGEIGASMMEPFKESWQAGMGRTAAGLARSRVYASAMDEAMQGIMPNQSALALLPAEQQMMISQAYQGTQKEATRKAEKATELGLAERGVKTGEEAQAVSAKLGESRLQLEQDKLEFEKKIYGDAADERDVANRLKSAQINAIADSMDKQKLDASVRRDAFKQAQAAVNSILGAIESGTLTPSGDISKILEQAFMSVYEPFISGEIPKKGMYEGLSGEGTGGVGKKWERWGD